MNAKEGILNLFDWIAINFAIKSESFMKTKALSASMKGAYGINTPRRFMYVKWSEISESDKAHKKRTNWAQNRVDDCRKHKLMIFCRLRNITDLKCHL